MQGNLDPRIFDLVSETGAFPIMPAYLGLTDRGNVIAPYDVGDALWLEIGNPERLEAARRAFGG